MKNVRDYQETMQKLYEAAMKYPDEKLAKAIGDVRDLCVEYKNIIDAYEITKNRFYERRSQMMNVKIVTWDGDLTQFLVEADTNVEAIRKAKEANFLIGNVDDEIIDDMKDPTTYTVEDVDFSLLCQIFGRNDYMGIYGEAVVFND